MRRQPKSDRRSSYRRLIFSPSILLVGAVGFAIMAGCDDGNPKTVRVDGKITMDGKPVPMGKITFYPKEGRPALGTIREDGSYTLTTYTPEDGATPGSHVVTINSVETIGGEDGPKSFEDEVAGVGEGSIATMRTKWIVPQRYSRRQSSKLTAEVELGKTNEINFELTP